MIIHMFRFTYAQAIMIYRSMQNCLIMNECPTRYLIKKNTCMCVY